MRAAFAHLLQPLPVLGNLLVDFAVLLIDFRTRSAAHFFLVPLATALLSRSLDSPVVCLLPVQHPRPRRSFLLLERSTCPNKSRQQRFTPLPHHTARERI
jgi:hypothetical protein